MSSQTGDSAAPSSLEQEAAIIGDIGVEQRLRDRMDDLSIDVEYDWLFDQFLASAESIGDSHKGYLTENEVKAQGVRYAMYQARRLEGEENRYPDDWEDRRQRVFRRDDYTCTECNDEDGGGPLHCHHRVHISQGGSHELHNLTTLCKECHRDKHPYANL